MLIEFIAILFALSTNIYVVAESSNNLPFGNLISLNKYLLYSFPHADKSIPSSYKILSKTFLGSKTLFSCVSFSIIFPLSYITLCPPIAISASVSSIVLYKNST